MGSPRRRRGSQCALHGEPAVDGPLVAVVSAEQHQNGVTAELEHLAAVGVCGADQRGEALVDELGDLLRSRLALAGKSLREGREAGDVR